MYTITLSDGTILPDLLLNCDNFISTTFIPDSIFDGNLSKVVITDVDLDNKVEYRDMILIQNKVMGEESWFILREQTTQEKTLSLLKNTIESNANGVTDVQIALAEVFELIMGGMQ